MKLPKTQLSDLEQIVLFWAYHTNFNDFPKLYRYTHPNTKTTGANLSTAASRWKNSAAVVSYLEKLETDKKVYEQKLQANWGNSGGTHEGPVFAGQIDFTDRRQFIDYLNRQINLLDDDKQKTDYLKMLSDLLRYKDTDAGKEAEIQRFYTPVTCGNCALYKANRDENL